MTATFSFPERLPDLFREAIPQTHVRLELTPFRAEPLAFSMLIPKGWAVQEDLGEQEVGPGVLTRLALVARNLGEAAPPLFQVSFMPFPLEVSLHHLLRWQAEVFSISLVQVKAVMTPVGPALDALGVIGPQEQRRVLRLLVFADDARVFFIMGMAAEALWEEVSWDVVLALHSFRLLAPTRVIRLEPYLVARVGAPPFFMVHPSSFVAKEVPGKRGRGGLAVALSNAESLIAYLRIKAIPGKRASASAQARLLKTAQEELGESGIAPGGAWLPDADPALEQIQGTQLLLRAPASSGGVDVDVRLAILLREGVYFVTTLIAVPERVERLLHLRAIRAYELALRSLTPGSPERQERVSE